MLTERLLRMFRRKTRANPIDPQVGEGIEAATEGLRRQVVALQFDIEQARGRRRIEIEFNLGRNDEGN